MPVNAFNRNRLRPTIICIVLHMLEQRYHFPRRVALGSFIFDTFFQTLALLGDAESSRSSPSAIYVAYSPHPYAPLCLFIFGMVCQILWLLRLYPVPISSDEDEDLEGGAASLSSLESSAPRRSQEHRSENIIVLSSLVEVPGTNSSDMSQGPEVPMIEASQRGNEGTGDTRINPGTEEPVPVEVVMLEPAQRKYIPFYMIGSLLQASWAATWMTRHYDYCPIVLYLNLAINLYVLFGILESIKSQRFPQASLLTQLVVKTRIAVSVLYLWKTWGAVDIVPPPSTTESILNCIFFIVLALASGPDPTLGFLLVIILFSLALGQHHNLEWHLLFNWMAVTVFFCVLMDWACGANVRKTCLPVWAESDRDEQIENY